MVRSSKGLRTGTRRKLSKHFKSKLTVTPYLRKFSVNDSVVIMPNPVSQKSMPHFRMLGASGVVKGMRGKAYIVEVKMGNKLKTITTKPEHLKPVPKR